MPDFKFVGVLSESWPDDWEHTGFVTEVVQRLEPGLAGSDAYLCGPPPMVDAAIDLLEMSGVPREHIHYDKFTTSVAE